jgi:hypothetical protein
MWPSESTRGWVVLHMIRVQATQTERHLLPVPFKELQPKCLLQLHQAIDPPACACLLEPNPCWFGVR